MDRIHLQRAPHKFEAARRLSLKAIAAGRGDFAGIGNSTKPRSRRMNTSCYSGR